MDLLNQWQHVNMRNVASPSESVLQITTSWTNPPINFLKCNVDAVIFKDPPRMGYGCIVRNHSGVVINAICGCITGDFNPTTAEAMGVHEALNWLKELKFSNVIVESDALLVVNAFQFEALDVFCLGLILEDCRLLASELLSCSFVFVRRSAN
ncbi:uncharacterized protein [Henckelia pumila]|uniref:uncharacterized protein n=1 Tax=Henckelia pumila TaxID=405737 RepID=UPI003C6DBC36